MPALARRPGQPGDSARGSNTFLADHIELVPTDSLKAAKRELRRHSDEQVSHIALSIREMGFLVPVIIDKANFIIAGHARWAAAKLLGLPRVPAIRASHLSPERVRAFALADNKLPEGSTWDLDALAVELKELSELTLDFDLELTGFKTAELDGIIAALETNDSDPADESPPPSSLPAVSRLGDLWQLGRHRLLCGSALDKISYERLLGDERVRMVFSDPPFNLAVSSLCGSGKIQHREFAMASGEMSEEEFLAFLTSALGQMKASVVEGGLLYLAMDHRHVLELISAARRNGLEQITLCVWNKTNAGMGSFYRSKHELFFVFKKPGAAHLNTVELGKHGRYRTNVWDYAGVNAFGRNRMAELSSHPTVKPVALVVDAIKDCTRRGDTVLDSFCGSGTTLIAAEKCGRVGYGIELDPVYVDVTIQRWQTLTGVPATLADSGRTFAEVADERQGDPAGGQGGPETDGSQTFLKDGRDASHA